MLNLNPLLRRELFVTVEVPLRAGEGEDAFPVASFQSFVRRSSIVVVVLVGFEGGFEEGLVIAASVAVALRGGRRVRARGGMFVVVEGTAFSAKEG